MISRKPEEIRFDVYPRNRRRGSDVSERACRYEVHRGRVEPCELYDNQRTTTRGTDHLFDDLNRPGHPRSLKSDLFVTLEQVLQVDGVVKVGPADMDCVLWDGFRGHEDRGVRCILRLGLGLGRGG
jgi:hypothetical protein